MGLWGGIKEILWNLGDIIRDVIVDLLWDTWIIQIVYAVLVTIILVLSIKSYIVDRDDGDPKAYKQLLAGFGIIAALTALIVITYFLLIVVGSIAMAALALLLLVVIVLVCMFSL